MYRNIERQGYHTQNELGSSSIYQDFDEIIVHIDRDGRYLFADSRHRLSIAKFLGLRSVPVIVARIHKIWVDLRKKIIDYAHEHYGGKIYHPIIHPDLSDIPYQHGYERWEMRKSHVGTMRGTVLDIGAHWGFFTCQFEKMGYKCIAVENKPEDVYFLRKLRNSKSRQFEIVAKSILDVDFKSSFSVILALNIFHHFLKSKSLYTRFIDLLCRLRSQIMFFQPHLQDEPQMRNAYKRIDEAEFVRMMQRKMHFSNSILIGRDVDGRGIYKLER